MPTSNPIVPSKSKVMKKKKIDRMARLIEAEYEAHRRRNSLPEISASQMLSPVSDDPMSTKPSLSHRQESSNIKVESRAASFLLPTEVPSAGSAIDPIDIDALPSSDGGVPDLVKGSYVLPTAQTQTRQASPIVKVEATAASISLPTEEVPSAGSTITDPIDVDDIPSDDSPVSESGKVPSLARTTQTLTRQESPVIKVEATTTPSFLPVELPDTHSTDAEPIEVDVIPLYTQVPELENAAILAAQTPLDDDVAMYDIPNQGTESFAAVSSDVEDSHLTISDNPVEQVGVSLSLDVPSSGIDTT